MDRHPLCESDVRVSNYRMANVHIKPTIRQFGYTLSSSSSPGSSSSRGIHRRRLDFSLLFLVWLCITLAVTPLQSHAQDILRPGGVVRESQFDKYFEDIECSVHTGGCCSDMSSVACQGWYCIRSQCAVINCMYCQDDPDWFCGPVEGVTRNHGLACKYKAAYNQGCNNNTMPCLDGMICSTANSTCQFTPEQREEYEDGIKSRRITMAGMIGVLIAMFIAMRRMLKNEEARRRQIWEPVDSSAEASILRRLAEDTQRRVTGGWGQLSESIVERGNAAGAAMGTAFTRIRENVRNATGGGAGQDDCDDRVEMLPNGRSRQTRRELEADMRDFLLEGDDDDDNDEDDNDEVDWSRSRDEDGLLSRHRSSEARSTVTSPYLQVPGAAPSNDQVGTDRGQELFPDEPPAYDDVRTNGQGQPSLIAGLGSDTETERAAERQESARQS